MSSPVTAVIVGAGHRGVSCPTSRSTSQILRDREPPSLTRSPAQGR